MKMSLVIAEQIIYNSEAVSVFHLDLSLDGRTLIFIEPFHRGKNCDMID